MTAANDGTNLTPDGDASRRRLRHGALRHFFPAATSSAP